MNKFTYIKEHSLVYITDYPFSSALKKSLVDELEKEKDVIDRESNVKATMTSWNYAPNNPYIIQFKKWILNEIKNFYNEGCFDPNFKFEPYFFNFWGNIYRKGDHTVTHNHFPSFFSISYFLKTKWYHSPFIFTNSKRKIRPKEGRIIIFPAHMYHHVPIHRFNDTRITLSGNVDLKGKGPLGGMSDHRVYQELK
tara:strand:+ start:746 stop:1330 length:585 start_codon:yes stop_codon:yes gene_type:complete